MRYVFFFSSRISIFSGVIGGGFWRFALTLVTQLFDPFRHREKTNIHCLNSVRDGVILVDNQLSGFAFEFRTKISSFHWCTCVVLR